jgi:hypothetical protein
MLLSEDSDDSDDNDDYRWFADARNEKSTPWRKGQTMLRLLQVSYAVKSPKNMSFDGWTARVKPGLEAWLEDPDPSMYLTYNFLRSRVIESKMYIKENKSVERHKAFVASWTQRIRAMKAAVRAGFNKHHCWHGIDEKIKWRALDMDFSDASDDELDDTDVAELTPKGAPPRADLRGNHARTHSMDHILHKSYRFARTGMPFYQYVSIVEPALKVMLSTDWIFDNTVSMETIVDKFRRQLRVSRDWFATPLVVRITERLRCVKAAIRAGFNKRHQWNYRLQRMKWRKRKPGFNEVEDCHDD